jgi:rhodanese-related sulfurtransferase
LPEPSELQQLTAAELEKECRQGVLILDTRAAEQFATFHIPKTLHIAEDSNSAYEAQNRLARVGLQNVIGYALADEKAWRRQGFSLISLPIHRCDDIRQALQEDRPLQLIDVRSRAEWLKGHLPGAISMPLLELSSDAASVDLSKLNVLYCEEGYRATTAASLLLRSNSGDLGILIDGMEGWRASDLPLETS